MRDAEHAPRERYHCAVTGSSSKGEGDRRHTLHPIAAITIGQQGDQLTEMSDRKDGGAVAVSDDGRCVARSDVMRRAMEYASTFDLPVIQHAEDHALTAGAAMHVGGVRRASGSAAGRVSREDVIVARDVIPPST